jgi:uncharacterized protein (TIGR02145 family)
MFDWAILAEYIRIIQVKVYGISILLVALLITGACSSKVDPVIIATREPGQITFDSAVSGGIIVFGGESGITELGLVWDTLVDPATEKNSGKVSVRITDHDFEVVLDHLEPETVYYVRAFAVNKCGTFYGDEQSFRTFYGEVTDADGNKYYTVKIGDREWMGSNLTASRYRNGEIIPNLTTVQEWSSASSGAWSSYSHDPQLHQIYGKLYNWHAVVDPRGLCPAGWHVPTDIEWIELEIELGISPSSAIRTGLRDRYAGGKLKETGTKHWLAPNTLATDEIGFSALPGGYRHSHGQFYTLRRNLNCWTSTEYSDIGALYRNIYFDNAGIYRNAHNKNSGLSIRCIRTLPVDHQRLK